MVTSLMPFSNNHSLYAQIVDDLDIIPFGERNDAGSRAISLLAGVLISPSFPQK